MSEPKLYLSEKAAKALGKAKDPEAEKARAEAEAAEAEKREAEEEARRREREAKDEEQRRYREKLQADRGRAAASDDALSQAIDRLEKLVEEAADRQRHREKRLEEAEKVKLRIRRLEENLAAEHEKLAALERATAEVVEDGLAEAAGIVKEAWAEHEDAWSKLPRGYMKKHRDRVVRRRFRALKLG